MRAAVILLCLTASLHADEERFAKVLESLKAAKAARVQAAQQKVDGLIKQKAGAVPIRKARAELEAVKKAEPSITENLPAALNAGVIGSLPGGSATIQQVAGQKDALAVVTFTVQSFSVRGNTVVPQLKAIEKTVWLKTSTAGFVDGNSVELPGVWEVTGTKTYTTALGGSNTVPVLEPFDAKAFQAWRAKNKK